MPYDKGDFTQQGVDGKVAGGLLLNNKRDVDVLVSSNEDDSTLGVVAVTIEDHLNDLKYAFWGENLEAGEVYEIGAGGGGTTMTVLIPEQIPGENGILTDVDPDINDLQYFIVEVENAGWPVVMAADEEGVWYNSVPGDTVLTIISSDGDVSIYFYDSINEERIYITDKVIAYKPYFDENSEDENN